MIITLLCGIIAGFSNRDESIVLTPADFSPIAETQPLPESIQELPRFLDQFLPPEGRGKTQLIPLYSKPDEYLILCKFTLTDDYENEQLLLERIARDYIFATYESCYFSNFPVVSSTIFIKCRNGKPGLTVGIGKKVADTVEPSIWHDRTSNPEEFMKWLHSHKCRAPDSWQKCTYAGIFAH